jgi:hypothetical protein
MLVPGTSMRPLVILTVLALVGCERHVALRPRDQDWIPRLNGIMRAPLESDSIPGAGGDIIVFNGGVTSGGVVYLAANRTRRAAILIVANSPRALPLVEHLVAEWARMGGFTPPPVF